MATTSMVMAALAPAVLSRASSVTFTITEDIGHFVSQFAVMDELLAGKHVTMPTTVLEMAAGDVAWSEALNAAASRQFALACKI